MENLQLSFKDVYSDELAWKVLSFSAGNICCEIERKKLEEKYFAITVITDKFTRRSVSYQLSKKDNLHRWLKYREGFSAELVSLLLNEFNIQKKEVILDPFLGSGTTSLVCLLKGISSIGFDILPMTSIALTVKKSVFSYDVEKLGKLKQDIELLNISSNCIGEPNYIKITQGAYPKEVEKELVCLTKWNDQSKNSEEIKSLITLCILNCLERVSYTTKDGQYLRWDYRSKKVQDAKRKREQENKKPLVATLNKGVIPSLKSLLIEELAKVITDIDFIQKTVNRETFNAAKSTFVEGSALFELPLLEENLINGVITSPPYCNRYDYTRTYALELTYLGKGENEIKTLRQNLLSCTVENKTKIDKLREHYFSLNRGEDFTKIIEIKNKNKALKEINQALHSRQTKGDINNQGVLQMVDGYFTELTFIFAEIYRISKPGSHIAFVNDNVRYGGEVIPVDFLCTELAEQIGFTPIKIYTLRQQKGNSSQQMKKFGRVPLRKSITIWKK